MRSTLNISLFVFFGLAACFGFGSVAWKAMGGGDVVTAFAESAESSGPQPRVEYVDYPDHDFGTMDVNVEGSATFRIGNSGNAPLKLKAGPSSCQCTLTNLVDNTIPPGDVGEVELRWKTQAESGDFAHGVTIWTNDPEETAIALRVTGEVRPHIEIEPRELVFPNSTPGEAPAGEFEVYFYKTDSARILRTQDAKSQWIQSIENLNEQELADNKALAGYRVKIELPADQEAGYFVHEIPIVVASEAPDGVERRIERLAVRGTVRSSFAVFGRNVRSNGVLKLGKLPFGQGERLEFKVVLRDADQSIDVRGFECPLPWVRFTATRLPNQSDKDQVFLVQITIPEDAPVCSHFGDGACPMKIQTNHPRVPVIQLRAEFAVLSPGVKPRLHSRVK